MSSLELEERKRLLVEMREQLLSIVENINKELSKIELEEGPSTQLVDPTGKPLAKVFERENEIVFRIYATFRVPIDDVTVKNFLIKKILDGLKDKGFSYEVHDVEGLVREIVVKGELTKEDVEMLRRTIAWVILKSRSGGDGNKRKAQ